MNYTGKKEPHPDINEDIEKAIWLQPEQVDEIAGNAFPSILEVIEAAKSIR